MRPPSRAFLVTLAVLLALAHAILAVTATTEKSMTADEIAHLTAGQAYNTLGDFRLQPENGNLPQRWAALPLTLAGQPLPPRSLRVWRVADVWNFGHVFFYEGPLAADEFLFLGRAMIALVSAATGLLIFFWSRAFFGWRGAFLSLALFAFCPAFLAHGALATSDVMMAFFFLAGAGAWWRHLERPGAAGAALSAVTLGLACVVKFSAVLLLPIGGLCALVSLIARARAGEGRAAALRLVRTTVLHGAVAWLIIWGFYGFRFSAFSPALATGAGFYRGDWDWILTGLGWQRRVIVALRDWRVLPEAFLYGFTFVMQFASQRAAFLNGGYSVTGWVSFFPYAFLVKNTLPSLALLLIGLGTLARLGWKPLVARLRPWTPLLALFAVYWATSLASHLNIGDRHILPTYPVLFIAAGAFGAWLDWRRPVAALLVGGLALCHLGEAWRVRPHYLAYFNPIAGGPANGWHHLVDSSLDWGQDLPALKTWLEANAPGEKAFLTYFGTGDPAYEGIRAECWCMMPDVGPRRRAAPFTAGVYAISATMLQEVYSPVRGDWTLALEQEFQTFRAIEPQLLAYQNDPAARSRLAREAPAVKWEAGWQRYDWLRLARLCHYLRVREPDANAGYSILIYRLTADEVRAATAGSLKDWSALIERTAKAAGT
jgi:hypothetical protein